MQILYPHVNEHSIINNSILTDIIFSAAFLIQDALYRQYLYTNYNKFVKWYDCTINIVKKMCLKVLSMHAMSVYQTQVKGKKDPYRGEYNMACWASVYGNMLQMIAQGN